MGGIVSSVTDTLGITNNKAANSMANTAATSAAASTAMTQEQLDFQKQQYNEWKSIYGDLQVNLGNYYKTLKASDYEAQGLQNVQKEYAVAKTQVDEQLAQRGIADSGIAAATDINFGQTLASARADIRTKAPQVVADNQMKFLGLGLGQGTQMLGINANVATGGANALMSNANNAMSNSASVTNANTNMTSSLLGAGIGYAVSDRRLKENLEKVYTLQGITFYTWTWNDIANSIGYNGKGFGVIAQEVKDIIPDSVYDNGYYLAVDYSKVLNYIGEQNELC